MNGSERPEVPAGRAGWRLATGARRRRRPAGGAGGRRREAGGGSRREGARAKRGGGGARAQPAPRARRRADNKQQRAGRCPRRCRRPRAVLHRPPGLSPPARRLSPRAPAARPRGPTDLGGEMEVLVAETTSQQERLQAIAEKRRRQAEIENRRRQLEDDRRQLQHLKSKALRERWLLAGTPSSASEGDEDLRRQMQEDEQKARLLEESISRLEQEIEELENADALPAAAKESPAAPSPARTPAPAPAPAPRPAQEDQRAEAVLNSQQAPVGTPKEKRISNTPLRTVDGSTMMKAVVHAVDGTAENGIHPLSSSEVDELIHKADEVTLSEAGSVAGSAEPRGPSEEAVRTTPSRREITGVQAQPGEATSGPPGIQPGQEPPVTMIFMGYQNVEDEAETQKVLGLQDTITAELVVIEDAAEPKEPAPPNGSAAEPPATEGSREENQVGLEAPASDPQDLDVKKQRCKCCSIM
ncbi:paralemmin-1 isoform X2 [Balaenoptera acutorostrata]|uniref:Paralemmin-1 n=1 Tax=Balaenoptera acutorostrata TaxID=9767 RepID=A0ABM3T4Y8_BALAC|nr:paralemmin-1 isoform X2 [Balaenoptera acutorostrata]